MSDEYNESYDIHYRLYVCLIYFMLNKSSLIINFNYPNLKTYEYELEKYEHMEKILNCCYNLCNTNYGYIYYDDIELILNTFMYQLNNQTFTFCKYHLENPIDEIRKFNFSYNVIKEFENNLSCYDMSYPIKLFDGLTSNNKFKNKIINMLRKIDYVYLFDIINILNKNDDLCNVLSIYIPNIIIDNFIETFFIRNIINIFFNLDSFHITHYNGDYKLNHQFEKKYRNINIRIIFVVKQIHNISYSSLIDSSVQKIIIGKYNYNEIFKHMYLHIYYNKRIEDVISHKYNFNMMFHKYNIEYLFFE